MSRNRAAVVGSSSRGLSFIWIKQKSDCFFYLFGLREGDHSLGNLLFLTTLSRINNFLIKIKLGRNGGRYNSHSAKRNISNFRVTKIYRVQRTYRMRSIYRQSICLFYNKLDILLRNSIYKSLIYSIYFAEAKCVNLVAFY